MHVPELDYDNFIWHCSPLGAINKCIFSTATNATKWKTKKKTKDQNEINNFVFHRFIWKRVTATAGLAVEQSQSKKIKTRQKKFCLENGKYFYFVPNANNKTTVRYASATKSCRMHANQRDNCKFQNQKMQTTWARARAIDADVGVDYGYVRYDGAIVLRVAVAQRCYAWQFCLLVRRNSHCVRIEVY